jgi:hippurate hydrolase
MEQIAKNTAQAFRARARVRYGGGCPTLVNDGEASRIALSSAKELVGEKLAFTSQQLGSDVKKNSGGSEDFAYIASKVPSVMIGLVAGSREQGYVYPLHHPKVRFDESVLLLGAELYASVGRALLAYEKNIPSNHEKR